MFILSCVSGSFSLGGTSVFGGLHGAHEWATVAARVKLLSFYKLGAEAGEDRETAVAATFDLDALANQRAAWGLFRDRRPELYDPLLTLDGEV